MRVLHLFLTISLSLSATAYFDEPTLQRRDIVPEDGIGISNRDLSLLPRSNTSDADSNKRETPDDHRLVPRGFTSGSVMLRLERGLFTGTVSFSGVSVPRVVFDTASGETWARFSSAATRGSTPFLALSEFHLSGSTSELGTVKVGQGLTSQMKFQRVGGRDSDTANYKGGLALDGSPTSFPNLLVNHDHISKIFAFLSLGNKVKFDFGEVDPRFKHIEWHKVGPGNTWTSVDKAKFKVNGKEVEHEEGFSVEINTGVPHVYASPHNVQSVYTAAPGSRQIGKRWMVPCDENIKVSISWGERDFRIEDFLSESGSTKKEGKRYCRGSLQTHWHPHVSDDTIVFGVAFLYDKYSAFRDDKGVREMGFTATKLRSGASQSKL